MDHRPLRLPDRRQLPLHPHGTGRQRVCLQRRLPHRPRKRIRHPDLRVRRLPGCGQHRVPDLRGPGRRPHPADGPRGLPQHGGARRHGAVRHGRRHVRRLRAARGSPRRRQGLGPHGSGLKDPKVRRRQATFPGR